MDEKKLHQETEKEPRPLTDREAGEVSGGKSMTPSWVQRGAHEGSKRGKLDGET